MEVTEQDGGLRAGDNQDNEDKEQEAEHVVHLMGPGNTGADRGWSLIGAVVIIMKTPFN